MNHNEEHEILNMDPIPERELADILWNTMQKDGHLNMYHVVNQFSRYGTPQEIHAALNKLLEKGRAYLTLGKTRMRCLWGWQRGNPGQ